MPLKKMVLPFGMLISDCRCAFDGESIVDEFEIRQHKMINHLIAKPRIQIDNVVPEFLGWQTAEAEGIKYIGTGISVNINEPVTTDLVIIPSFENANEEDCFAYIKETGIYYYALSDAIYYITYNQYSNCRCAKKHNH